MSDNDLTRLQVCARIRLMIGEDERRLCKRYTGKLILSLFTKKYICEQITAASVSTVEVARCLDTTVSAVEVYLEQFREGLYNLPVDELKSRQRIIKKAAPKAQVIPTPADTEIEPSPLVIPSPVVMPEPEPEPLVVNDIGGCLDELHKTMEETAAEFVAALDELAKKPEPIFEPAPEPERVLVREPVVEGVTFPPLPMFDPRDEELERLRARVKELETQQNADVLFKIKEQIDGMIRRVFAEQVQPDCVFMENLSILHRVVKKSGGYIHTVRLDTGKVCKFLPKHPVLIAK